MAVYIDPSIAGDPAMLENLFQQIIVDLKVSFPIWDDFMSKASKLHSVLRSAVGTITAFLESLQKVADMALGTRGATSDLGSALTRLCLRQKGLEDKLKAFVSSIMECLVNPLQDRMDEWKKMVALLDKDHAKESKRIHQEMKKAFAETVALKKKTKKGKPGAGAQLEQAVAEYKEKYEMLEALEKNSVKMALIEERSRFCHFINCINPVMDRQLAMLSEMTHISEIINYLQIQSLQPCFSPNHCYQVREWKKTNSPDRMAPLSSPASPCVSRGSPKSNQSGFSGDGCCSSPKSLPGKHDQKKKCFQVTGRKPSNDSSSGIGEEQEFNQFAASHPFPVEWMEQQTSRTFPAAAKANALNLTSQRADHHAACCPQCQSYQLPVKKAIEKPVSAPTASENQAVEAASADEGATAAAPTEKAPEVSENTIVGYVNMNQLASLAVQQGEFAEKTESNTDNTTDIKDKDDSAAKSDKKTEKVDENDNVEKNSKGSQKSHGASEGCYGRSRTTEDIAVNKGSLHDNVNGDKSKKTRDFSLPPTFRKPFRTGGASIFGGSPRLFSSSTNRGHSELRGSTSQEPKGARGRAARIPSSESPPPPPLPEDYPTCTELVLESDYLPLPPPPVALQDSGPTVGWSRKLQFSTIPEVNILSSDVVMAGGRPGDPLQTASKQASSSEGGACGGLDLEDAASNTFADSIRQGVKLRRTLTNDRSAPRLPSN